MSEDVSVSAWCLRSEGVSSVLLGVSNTEQLMENLGSIGVRGEARQPPSARHVLRHQLTCARLLQVLTQLTPALVAEMDALLGNKPKGHKKEARS